MNIKGPEVHCLAYEMVHTSAQPLWFKGKDSFPAADEASALD
ncbi:hypothetical protein [Wenzhouxiangella sp. AB-CW3]|nr:hypothetical protein [Wenzhouxiangella sp. AB-CW3]